MIKLAAMATLGGSALLVAGELYPSITAYNGKYAYEEVNGWRFFDDPSRVALIEAASSDRGLVALVQSDDVVTAPIEVDESQLRAIYWACEPHNCGSHNWALVIDRMAQKAAICQFDEDAGKFGVWHVGGQPILESDLQCPFELSQVPEEIAQALDPQIQGP